MSKAVTPLPSGVAAVILAAGHSSRMQSLDPVRSPGVTHKALLPFPRKPLIVVQAENYLAAGVARVYCVLGWSADLIRPVVESTAGVEVVINDDWSSGMFSSIKRGLEAAGTATAIFLQPVDVPPPSRKTLTQLAAAGAAGVVIPMQAGRGGHPLYINSSVFGTIAAQPPGDRLDRILREVLPAKVRQVEIKDADCLWNLNSPEDWREFHKKHPGLPESG